jgi:predicted patatin/cPLA2 family phospholipase
MLALIAISALVATNDVFVQTMSGAARSTATHTRDHIKATIATENLRAFTAQDAATAVVPNFPKARFFANSEAEFLQALPATAKPGTWLVLSAGGEDGAFSAGILNGWSAAGTRPDFEVVTGVSAGALLAPYAFLGPRYDDQMHSVFTTVTDADIFESASTASSLLNTWPLRELLAKLITPQLVADVAAEYRRGRRLFVVTSNLDAGQSVVWNMGAIAAHGDEQALRLFQDVLMASASLPGVFPPVYITVESNGHYFREMHADGGIGGPFFVGPDSWLANTSEIRLPAKQIYVIVNGKLTPDFEITPSNHLAILGRAFSGAVRTGARAEIAEVLSATQRDGISLKLAHIDTAFQHASHGAFDPDYMKALYDFGFRQAQSGQAFSEPIRVSQRSTP